MPPLVISGLGERWVSLQVPVFYHSCNFTGPYTDEALKTVAKFPFVTIEKGQGVTLCASPPPLRTPPAA